MGVGIGVWVVGFGLLRGLGVGMLDFGGAWDWYGGLVE